MLTGVVLEILYLLVIALGMFVSYRLAAKENKRAAVFCILFIGMEHYLDLLLRWLFP